MKIPRLALALLLMPGTAVAQSAPAPTADDGKATAASSAPKPADTGKKADSAPPEEENLLAQPAATPSAKEKGKKGKKGENEPETFGAELLDLMGVSASWHGYGDVLFSLKLSDQYVGQEAVSDFEASANPILTARMGQSFSAETELELSTDDGIGAEYFIVDYTVSAAFTLRAGKFIAPIGRFNEVLHPSFRWDMISRPLMMNEVIPTTWTPVGIQARGTVTIAIGSAFEYAVYVTNGFSGQKDFLTHQQVVYDLHDNFQDSNNDKAVGARVGIAFGKGQEVGDTEIGVSGYTGAVDPAASQRLSILDVDLRVKLGPVRLRGEAAESFLGPDSDPFVGFEQGAYFEVSYTHEKVGLAARWDYASVRPAGGDPNIRHVGVVSFKYAASTFWSFRGEVDVPLITASMDHTPDLLTSIAYSF